MGPSDKNSSDDTYVDLGRRYVDAERESQDVESLQAMADVWGINHTLGWDDLQHSQRVVVLADAGSGKTVEMKEQVKRLIESYVAAFFVPLQALADEGLRACLEMSEPDIVRFEKWLADGAATAWFFLDSVDELKLTTTTLSTALGRVARDLRGAMVRARFVISCRPWDWRPIDDLETVRSRLPPNDPVREELPSGEAAFLRAVRDAQGRKKETPKDPEKNAQPIRVVNMLPLSAKQIGQFLKAKRVPDDEKLMDELIKQEALPFARRPLDLRRISQSWTTRRTLGTRRQQHEDDVQYALKDRTDRLDTRELPDSDAIEGVERLALAMMLTKSRALQDIDSVAEVIPGEATISPAEVLHDWPPSKVAALLRRAIFDPATYGRVQFHHRSVQEFLAARRLATLRGINLSGQELSRLLFADTYGETVLIPSMRPIAAWLAISLDEVAREILKREPEVLVQFGDPASLTVGTRRALLHAFVDSYSAGGWRGLRTPTAEMRRLANVELSDDIRSCWAKRGENVETTEFLLELIYLASIEACADLAFSAAMDASLEPTARFWAIRALLSCGCHKELGFVAADMLANPDRWPERVLIHSAASLFPEHLSAADLVALIDRVTPTKRHTTDGFGWTLLERVKEIPALSDASIELRDGLTQLISNGREPSGDPYSPNSVRHDLTQALAILCARQLDAGCSDQGLVRAALLAYRLHGDRGGTRDECSDLRAAVARRPDLRRSFALAEIEFARSLQDDRGAWNLYYLAAYHSSLTGQFQADDWDWLLAEIESGPPENRDVMLVALTDIWWARGESALERDALIGLAGNEEALSLVQHRTTRREPSEDEIRLQREGKKRDREWERQRERDVASWAEWKREADLDPAAKFAPDKLESSLFNLLQWLKMEMHVSNKLAQPNWPSVRRALGDAIGDLFEAALRDYWRNAVPPLRSEATASPTERRGHAAMALTSLALEASVAGWARNLSTAEATKAAEWGTLEMNGFPEWYGDLAAAHPTAIRDVLKKEIAAELGVHLAVNHPLALSAVQYGPDAIKAVMAPTIAEILRNSSVPLEPERQADHAENADRILATLVAANAIDDSLVQLCRDRILADVTGAAAGVWLHGVFAGGLKAGLSAFQAALDELPAEDRKDTAIRWVAALFGRDHSRYPIDLSGEASDLLALARLVAGHVLREEDVEHDGVYSPDIRDDAETGRGVIITKLLELPGKNAHAALLEMASDPLLAHVPDRLRLLARERAALDSELTQLSTAKFKEWEKTQAWPPSTPAELFVTMMDRLRDIERDVRHHPFNDREILAAMTEEKLLQPPIARRLGEVARGAYTIEREPEVAGKKKPDFRLAGLPGAGKAAIELKIGDNKWSVADLEDTLKTQLLGQYLRHPDCHVGILLVSYAGRKRYRHPVTGKSMSFEQLIVHLREYSAELQRNDPRDVHIGVATIDVRDPLKAM